MWMMSGRHRYTSAALQPLDENLASPFSWWQLPLRRIIFHVKHLQTFIWIFHVSPATEKLLILLKLDGRSSLCPFFHSLTAQLSGMREKMEPSFSSHRRAQRCPYKACVDSESWCACKGFLSPPASDTQGYWFHLGGIEFMGSSSFPCAVFVQVKHLGHQNHLGVPCLPSLVLNNK